LFVIPAIDRLCALLGVRSKVGDRLRPEDLESLASYRAALHAALIRRAPGKYPRRWQAERLGISKASCRRYEKRTGIHAHATFRTWAVTWGNLEKLLSDDREMGRFLEDEKGRRYPALRVLARKLLAQGKRLLFRSQDANHYELRDGEALPAQSLSTMAIPHKETAQLVAPWVAGARRQREARRKTNERNTVLSGQITLMRNRPEPNHRVNRATRSRNAKHPVFDRPPISDRSTANVIDPEIAEACGERLYNTLRNLNRQCSITRKKARQFVDEYGVTQVERSLQVLINRRNVRNPAGFMRVLLRSQRACTW
jgi:hypothetical protein